jgi:hypothetical protein
LTNTTTLSLTVNATGGGLLTVSPTSIKFGNVKLDNTAKKIITLTNVGTVKLGIGPFSFTVTAGNPTDFKFHSYCKANLNPGKSCTIAVTFFADAISTDAATLNIASSAPGSPLEVPITATVVKR